MSRTRNSPALGGCAGYLIQASGSVSGAPEISPHPFVSARTVTAVHPVRRTPLQGNGKRETFLTRDTLFTLLRDGIVHVVSENYDYKTEPYYTILNYESQGVEVRPSSRAVLDAYVVPICLERAERAGIRVCEWGISQGYVPLPAIIYGLNYFATTSDLFLVRDAMNAREVIKHVTNKGKYPFCYQKLPEEREIHTCPAIFGKTVKSCSRVADIADRIYDIFGIPLVRMTMVRTGNEFALSSLSPMPYSQMSEGERSVLSAHLRHQEFL